MKYLYLLIKFFFKNTINKIKKYAIYVEETWQYQPPVFLIIKTCVAHVICLLIAIELNTISLLKLFIGSLISMLILFRRISKRSTISTIFISDLIMMTVTFGLATLFSLIVARNNIGKEPITIENQAIENYEINEQEKNTIDESQNACYSINEQKPFNFFNLHEKQTNNQ